jgi:protocatechuate 3,4-dioxygenase beta subunit
MKGDYYFRTIKPVAYPGRPAPHIHFKVRRAGKELLTTQCYIKGEKQNERDFIFRSLRTPEAKKALLVDFVPLKGTHIRELTAKFDIVLGATPEG